MALSGGLEKAGKPATRVATEAACTVEKVGDAFKITKMKLVVRGKVPGMDQAAFVAAAEAAKDGCPVSGALKGNVAFELDAKLE
jgi:osmotically inducible protein OsmC